MHVGNFEDGSVLCIIKKEFNSKIRELIKELVKLLRPLLAPLAGDGRGLCTGLVIGWQRKTHQKGIRLDLGMTTCTLMESTMTLVM